MLAARARVALASRLAVVARAPVAGVRAMGGGGHGHGGPTKTLPPKPASLPDNASIGDRIEYALWEQRHPDYSFPENLIRFWLPQNHMIVLAILGLYAGIAGYYQVKGGFTKADKVRSQPAPTKPDFHTPIVVTSDIPSFGTPEWERYIEAGGDKAFEDWMMAPTSEKLA